jgi:hypothetical protein
VVFGKKGVAFDAISVKNNLNGQNGIRLYGILSNAQAGNCVSGA